LKIFYKYKKYSINNSCCYSCGNLKDIYYCFECSNSYCKNCESKHIKKNHNKIFKKEDYNKICPKHFKYYKVYCETCKLLLCEDCPTFHIKHDLSKKSIYFENELNDFKNEIEKIENKRNEFNSPSYLPLFKYIIPYPSILSFIHLLSRILLISLNIIIPFPSL
jgi:hypothetical protein